MKIHLKKCWFILVCTASILVLLRIFSTMIYEETAPPVGQETTKHKTRLKLKANDFHPIPLKGNIVNAKSELEIFGSDSVVHEINFPYLIKNAELCSMDNVFIIIYIHSAPDKRHAREQIRQSWGSVSLLKGLRIRYIFLLGVSRDQSLMKTILDESKLYSDLVQVDFMDSYRNLTIKNIQGLKWIMDYCSGVKYVIKLDDDTLIDPFHLVEFLSSLEEDSTLMLCSVMTRIGVPKDFRDKWHIPASEYPYHYYPPYCEGFGYIMTSNLISQLYNASRYVPYFWIDDVYVTGFLMYHLNLKPKHFPPGQGAMFTTNNIDEAEIKIHIFFLAKNSFYAKNWEAVWKRILSIHGKDSII